MLGVEPPQDQSQFQLGERHVHSTRFSPDGELLVAVFRYAVQLRSTEEGDNVRQFQAGVNVSAVAFSPDGQLLALADRGECRIEFWDVSGPIAETPALVFEEPTPPGETEAISAIAFSPDGKTLAIAGEREVRLLDLESRSIRHRLKERMVLSLAYSPDGTRLATGRYDGLKLWNTTTNEPVGVNLKLPAVESIAFASNGHQIAAGCFEGLVGVWNAADGTPVWQTTLAGKQLLYLPTKAVAWMFMAWLAAAVLLIARKLFPDWRWTSAWRSKRADSAV